MPTRRPNATKPRPAESARTEHDEIWQQFLQLLRREAHGVPKYVRLRAAIAEGIARGFWRAGHRLPTELEFVRMTALSQGTVQRALSELEGNGAITRTQGSGTFVSKPQTRLANILVCRFLNDDETDDLPLFSEVVRRDFTIPVGAWTQHFAADEPVFRIDRRLSVNNEFYLLSRCYMSKRRFPQIATCPLQTLSGVSLKTLIADQISSRVTEAVRTIRIGLLPNRACQAMGIPARTVGGIVEAIGRSAAIGTVYFHEVYVPPTARKMVVTEAQ